MKLVANPFASVQTDSHTIPALKINRRPYRSARTPEKSRNPPNVSVYALSNHCKSPAPTPNSACTSGSDRFTAVMNTLSINCAPHVMTKTNTPCHVCIDPMSGYAVSGNISGRSCDDLGVVQPGVAAPVGLIQPAPGVWVPGVVHPGVDAPAGV